MQKHGFFFGNQKPGMWKSLAVAIMGFAMAASACSGCDENAGGGNNVDTMLLPPTVDPAPPEITNEATLSLAGTRVPGTAVRANIDGASEDVEVAPLLATAVWEGSVELQEGPNTMRFYVQDASGRTSTNTIDYTIVLDTMAPGQPTLKETPPPCVEDDVYTLEGTLEEGAKLLVDGQEVETDGRNFAVDVTTSEDGTTVTLVQVDAAGNEGEPLEVTVAKGLAVPLVTNEDLEDGTHITSEITYTLTGTKQPGMGVLLRKDGNDEAEFIVEPDGNENWSFELELTEGDNTFFITGRTTEGENSCTELGPLTITQSSVCPPIITNAETFPELTNDSDLPVTGTRCSGVATFIVFEGQDLADAAEVVGADAPEDFDYVQVLEEGINNFSFFNRDAEGLVSPLEGPFEVELDTIPPNPPLYDPEPPAAIGQSRIELRGTKDRDANVCVRADIFDCEPLGPPNAATQFSFDQELSLGDNNICISSFDRAGNQSEETCAFIERVNSNIPEIIIETPTNGSPINDAPFFITATVLDETELEEVEICFDEPNDCEIVTSNTESYSRQVTPRNLINGNAYSITVRAQNILDGIATATIDVLYVTEGIVLSNSAPELPSERARLALDGEGRVHAIWQDECAQSNQCAQSNGNLPFDIFHRMYDGVTWSPITVISNDVNDSESEGTAIAADSAGNIHVVWADNGDIQGSGSDFDLVHRTFNIADDTWGPISLITPNVDESDLNPALAAGGDGSLHVVWERRTGEDSPQDVDIYYSRNTGGDWAAPTKLSTDAGNNRGGNAAVGADSLGTAYVVWQDDGDVLDSGEDTDIYLKTVDGEFISDVTVVSDSARDGNSFAPRIAMGPDDRAHIIWEDTSNLFGSGDDLDIFYRTYILNEGFEGNYVLVSNDPLDGDSQEAAITIDPDTGDAFVAWVDLGEIGGSGTDPDIYFARLFDGIPDFPSLVSNGRSFIQVSEFPDLLVDPVADVLHIVWEDDSTVGIDGEDRDIFYLGIQLDD